MHRVLGRISCGWALYVSNMIFVLACPQRINQNSSHRSVLGFTDVFYAKADICYLFRTLSTKDDPRKYTLGYDLGCIPYVRRVEKLKAS